MKKGNVVVVKKECHSRVSLSGIFNACCYKNKGNALLNEYVKAPCFQFSGMTANCIAASGLTLRRSVIPPLRAGDSAEYSGCTGFTSARHPELDSGSRRPLNGFTLIELLVVVLIIGILAAVALPQYQKAVEKSRAAEGMSVLKTVYHAATVHYLTNGSWPTKFDQLDVNIPWTGKTKVSTNSKLTDTKSNDTWSLQMIVDTGNAYEKEILISHIGGPYAKAGFMMCYTCYPRIVPEHTLLCIDPAESGYCKLFNGKRMYALAYSSTPSPYLLP